jgi:uncharacterized membrane protein YqaE (UPF0057 family)
VTRRPALIAPGTLAADALSARRAARYGLALRKSESTLRVKVVHREVIAMDIIRIIFAILLPPVGVFLQVGFGLHFWLNILLTLLGYIPGIIHAVWIIVRR